MTNEEFARIARDVLGEVQPRLVSVNAFAALRRELDRVVRAERDALTELVRVRRNAAYALSGTLEARPEVLAELDGLLAALAART